PAIRHLSVRVEHKARLTYRTVHANERGHVVLCPIFRCHCNLRIDLWARSADIWKRMAAGATVEIETWTEAFGDRIDLHKYGFCGLKERFFIGAETGKRATGRGWQRTHARVYRL